MVMHYITTYNHNRWWGKYRKWLVQHAMKQYRCTVSSCLMPAPLIAVNSSIMQDHHLPQAMAKVVVYQGTPSHSIIELQSGALILEVIKYSQDEPRPTPYFIH